MSRVGLSPVTIPEGVEVNQNADVITVKGKLGELTVPVLKNISVSFEGGEAVVTPANKVKTTRQSWGTVRSLLAQAVVGVTEGFKKQLEMQGVGYRANVQGSNLNLQLGFSHDVVYAIPSDLKIAVDGNVITIEGINAQRVGQVASEIRGYRPPEPYKGKGVRYVGEQILRKEGKKK
ncbi:MAG: 50S ribosomal protein L6 [Alphaproteobacteria bacterium]